VGETGSAIPPLRWYAWPLRADSKPRHNGACGYERASLFFITLCVSPLPGRLCGRGTVTLTKVGSLATLGRGSGTYFEMKVLCTGSSRPPTVENQCLCLPKYYSVTCPVLRLVIGVGVVYGYEARLWNYRIADCRTLRGAPLTGRFDPLVARFDSPVPVTCSEVRPSFAGGFIFRVRFCLLRDIIICAALAHP